MDSALFRTLPQASAVLLMRGVEVESGALVGVIVHLVGVTVRRISLDDAEVVHPVIPEAVADVVPRALP